MLWIARPPFLSCLVLSSLLLMLLPSTGFAYRSTTRFVTHGGDSGPGSFRAAVAAASLDQRVGQIVFRRNLDVVLSSDVVYSGSQPLLIQGHGSALIGDSLATPAPTWDGGLFVSVGGADLRLINLELFDSFNNGLGVFVPETQKRRVSLRLENVTIERSRFHGVLFDGQLTTGFNTDDVIHPDCLDPHPFEGPASIQLSIVNSNISNNGTLSGGFDTGTEFERDGETVLTGCPADFDGVRVDEGGGGDVRGSIWKSTVDGNLADGIEFDERGAGGVTLLAGELSVSGNGETGTNDLDDGIDLDEADEGDLTVYLMQSTVVANRDEGLDFDEAGAGSVAVFLYGVDSTENEDEGLKIDEAGEGDLILKVFESRLNDSLSQDGVELTEEDGGDLSALFSRSDVTGNDNDGIKAEQAGPGEGRLRVERSDLTGNGGASFDLDGIVETIVDSQVD